MKKSLLIATALTALSVAGNAMALDVSRARALQVEGLAGPGLGILSFTPLGRDGAFCDYLTDWESPFNPNDVVICILRELRTPFAPSCIINELTDFTTIVQGGGQVACAGFNLKGEAYNNVQLVLSECDSGLSGVLIIPSGGVAQTYPVRATGC